jgi:hypothetical protein
MTKRHILDPNDQPESGSGRERTLAVILNSALSRDMDSLEQQIFFGFIERFTELHLLMLKMLKNPDEWPGRSGMQQFGRSMNSVLRNVLTDGLPQLTRSTTPVKVPPSRASERLTSRIDFSLSSQAHCPTSPAGRSAIWP